MSAKLVGLALSQGGLHPTEKLILIALADCTNTHTGKCFPSIQWLAAVAECSERTVQRWLRELESKRLIETVPRAGTSNLFLVLTGGDTHVTPSPEGVTPTSPGGDIAMSPTPDIAMSPEPEGTRKNHAADPELEPDGSVSAAPHHYCRTERAFVDLPKSDCPTNCQPKEEVAV